MKAALWLLAAVLAAPAVAQSAADAETALDGFGDAIHHWRNVHGRDYPRHAPSQVREIADNLLLHQRRDGGWIENQDPARVLSAADRERLAAEALQDGGSFDNRNVHTQIDYLLAAHSLTGDARYLQAAVRGLEFTLAHQIPGCGGWPHTVPARQRFHPLITFADDVTAGVLGMLRGAAQGEGRYAALDAALRQRAAQAVARGDDCVLQLQIRQDGGGLTGWAGQYDPQTLRPAQGRSFELSSIAVQETVGVVRYLMSIPDPSPQAIAAVEGAVAWLRRVALDGWRLEAFAAEPEQYRHHRSDEDRRLVRDPSAPPLWARFHDVADDSVVLATREGVRVADYAQIPRERRTGYAWYGQWPQALLEKEYPAWRAAHAAAGR